MVMAKLAMVTVLYSTHETLTSPVILGRAPSETQSGSAGPGPDWVELSTILSLQEVLSQDHEGDDQV